MTDRPDLSSLLGDAGALSPSQDALLALAKAVSSEPAQAILEGFGDSERQDVVMIEAVDLLTPHAAGGAAADLQPGERQAPGAGPAARDYAAECEALGVQPHPWILDQLGGTPEILYVEQALSGLRTHAGGAVLSFSVPATAAAAEGEEAEGQPSMPNAGPLSAPQLEAALRVVLGRERSSSGHVLIMKHLGLSGNELTPAMWELLLSARRRLQGYLRLTSVELAGCSLTLGFFQELICHQKPSIYALLKGLERLELGGNPSLCRLEGGSCCSAVDIRSIDMLLSGAPLKYLGLEHIGMSNAVLAHTLCALCFSPTTTVTAELARQLAQHQGHEGASNCLECLKLGPPGDSPHFSEAVVALLAKLVATLPRLQVLEVHGLTGEQQGELAAKWGEAKGETACFSGVVGSGAFRLSTAPLDEPCVAELAPAEHEMPGPATPPQALGVEGGGMEEDSVLFGGGGSLAGPAASEGRAGWGQAGRSRAEDGGVRCLPAARRRAASQTAGQGGSQRQQAGGAAAQHGSEEPSRSGGALVQQRLHLPSLQHREQLQQAGATRQRGDGPRQQQQQFGFWQEQLRGEALELGAMAAGIAPPRQAGGAAGKKRRRRQGDSAAPRPPRQYGPEDELVQVEIDVWDEPSPSQSAGTDDSSGSEGVEPSRQQTRLLREGEFDDDDKAGVRYKRQARALVEQIPDPADQKAARGALKLWDRMGDAPYDRMRFINPPKDCNDEDTLVHLLTLVTLLEKHCLHWGFTSYIPKRAWAEVAPPKNLYPSGLWPNQGSHAEAPAAVAVGEPPSWGAGSGDNRRPRQQQQQLGRASSVPNPGSRALKASSEWEGAAEAGGGVGGRTLPRRRLHQVLDSDSSDSDNDGGASLAAPTAGDAFGGGSSSPVDLTKSEDEEEPKWGSGVGHVGSGGSIRAGRLGGPAHAGQGTAGEGQEALTTTAGVVPVPAAAAAVSAEGAPPTTEVRRRFKERLERLVPSPIQQPALGTHRLAAAAPTADLDRHAPAVHTDLPFLGGRGEAFVAAGERAQRRQQRPPRAPAAPAAGPAVQGPVEATEAQERALPTELRGLQFFGWDKRNEVHPANPKHFGVVEGRRQRAEHLPQELLSVLDDSQPGMGPFEGATQLTQQHSWETPASSDSGGSGRGVGSDGAEQVGPSMGEGLGGEAALRPGQGRRRRGPQQRAQAPCASESDPDDDLPLVQLFAATRLRGSAPAATVPAAAAAILSGQQGKPPQGQVAALEEGPQQCCPAGSSPGVAKQQRNTAADAAAADAACGMEADVPPEPIADAIPDSEESEGSGQAEPAGGAGAAAAAAPCCPPTSPQQRQEEEEEAPPEARAPKEPRGGPASSPTRELAVGQVGQLRHGTTASCMEAGTSPEKQQQPELEQQAAVNAGAAGSGKPGPSACGAELMIIPDSEEQEGWL